ncbi:hypothetical protein V6N13_139089 [Hibiscus sabdariffa]
MKIRCDVCDREEASVFCTADEAALCDACDHRVHHANKLASKHQRFSLLHPSSSKQVPLCDICQSDDCMWPFLDADLESNMSTFSPESLGLWVPQSPSSMYPLQMGGQIGFKETKEIIGKKANRRWTDDSFTVPQISPQSTASKRSKHLWIRKKEGRSRTSVWVGKKGCSGFVLKQTALSAGGSGTTTSFPGPNPDMLIHASTPQYSIMPLFLHLTCMTIDISHQDLNLLDNGTSDFLPSFVQALLISPTRQANANASRRSYSI